MYTVYQHINKTNGKRYIGITSNAIKRRWNNGLGYKPAKNTDNKFWNAIVKYGWLGFEHIVLATGLTKEEAEEMERQLIKEYNTIENGYNILPGGDASQPGWHQSQETKEKIRKANSGENGYWYGKQFDEQHIENLKKSHPGILVRCVETGVIYRSYSDAEKQTGICKANISRVCRGGGKTAGGFHWEQVKENPS